MVPVGCAAGIITGFCSGPSTDTAKAFSSSAVLDVKVSLDTDAIEAKASPRKPKVVIEFKSSDVEILEVACGASAKGNSSLTMPLPLSRTRTKTLPAFLISQRMEVPPASTAFSNNSLTTEAGRSTTSPAAI